MSVNFDHPVESLTWVEAAKFANAYSIKKKLKPTYIFSAEDPTQLVGINAPQENIYKAEGFRLATAAEYDYVLTAGGVYEVSFSPTTQEVAEYYELQKSALTFPVGYLFPHVFSGNTFYDLYGMQQFTHDAHDSEGQNDDENNFPMVIDPYRNFNVQRLGFNNKRIVRGSGYDILKWVKSKMEFGRSVQESRDRLPTVGVRLARTINPGS